jgi:NTP pyrophosphatase (non-canonical NTP hydrolase)
MKKTKDKDYKKSMEKTIDNYGQVQLLIACEEMGELIQAISKMERAAFSKADKGKLKNHIVEEIADVLIILDELLLYYGIDVEEVDKAKNMKIARLKKRAKLM